MDCTDAIAAALQAAAGQAGQIINVRMTWRVLCAAAVCESPAPNVMQGLLRLSDGRTLGVVVHRSADGAFATEPVRAISPAALEPIPSISSPPKGIIALDHAPSAIAARTPEPVCGRESAGLAGPFDAEIRACFLNSLMNASGAEFLSMRSDVGGQPFVELWRFEGRGPILVFTEHAGRWLKLNCAVLLVTDGRQRFGHTDCMEMALP